MSDASILLYFIVLLLLGILFDLFVYHLKWSIEMRKRWMSSFSTLDKYTLHLRYSIGKCPVDGSVRGRADMGEHFRIS